MQRRRGALLQLRAPQPDLVWVDLELLRPLDQYPVGLDRGDGHLRLECCRMVTARSFDLLG
jgi:hypothetical protein